MKCPECEKGIGLKNYTTYFLRVGHFTKNPVMVCDYCASKYVGIFAPFEMSILMFFAILGLWGEEILLDHLRLKSIKWGIDFDYFLLACFILILVWYIFAQMGAYYLTKTKKIDKNVGSYLPIERGKAFKEIIKRKSLFSLLLANLGIFSPVVFWLCIFGAHVTGSVIAAFSVCAIYTFLIAFPSLLMVQNKGEVKLLEYIGAGQFALLCFSLFLAAYIGFTYEGGESYAAVIIEVFVFFLPPIIFSALLYWLLMFKKEGGNALLVKVSLIISFIVWNAFLATVLWLVA